MNFDYDHGISIHHFQLPLKSLKRCTRKSKLQNLENKSMLGEVKSVF